MLLIAVVCSLAKVWWMDPYDGQRREVGRYALWGGGEGSVAYRFPQCPAVLLLMLDSWTAHDHYGRHAG